MAGRGDGWTEWKGLHNLHRVQTDSVQFSSTVLTAVPVVETTLVASPAASKAPPKSGFEEGTILAPKRCRFLAVRNPQQCPLKAPPSDIERHRATPSATVRHRAPQLGMNQRTVQLPRFCSKPLRFFLSNSPMSACAASQRPSTAPEFARAPTVPECRNKSVHLVNPYPRCQSVNGLTHHQASHRHRKEPADSADFIPSESASWRSTIHDDHRRPSLTGARRFT